MRFRMFASQASRPAPKLFSERGGEIMLEGKSLSATDGLVGYSADVPPGTYWLLVVDDFAVNILQLSAEADGTMREFVVGSFLAHLEEADDTKRFLKTEGMVPRDVIAEIETFLEKKGRL